MKTTEILLESVGGAVPLNSRFYVSRDVDQEIHQALTRRDVCIPIGGARQIGKTSLLARGLVHARNQGARVILTDFQKLNATDFETESAFFLALAESLADQLDLDDSPYQQWDDTQTPQTNFESYLQHHALSKLTRPLVWGIDEADRVFVTPFAATCLAHFRNWFQHRAGFWKQITFAIGYATEANLFLPNLDPNPFGIKPESFRITDFTFEQVSHLNSLHGSPLSQSPLREFYEWVGGHPFLIRLGLFHLASHKINFSELAQQARHDDGIFSDHLNRILFLLNKDLPLKNELHQRLQGQPLPPTPGFQRLIQAGILRGASPSPLRFRCKLYHEFLSRHLQRSPLDP